MSIDDIQPCPLQLVARRAWLPRSPRKILIGGEETSASMTASSALLFKSGQVEGALVASSKTRGYWIYQANGFSAPLGAEIGELADAFDLHERARSNVAVDFG